MRFLIAVLLVLLPLTADAQSPRTATGVPQTPALPPIGLPLPPLGLSLPAIGLPPAEPTAAPTRATTPPREHGRHTGERRRARTTPGMVYVVPAYGWIASGAPVVPGMPTTALPAAPEPPPARTPTGTLRLDLQPRVAGQVFVDGSYIGTLDDVGHELTLEAGKHRLEIRHPGFATLVLPVQIDDGRALVYRGVLQPEAAVPAPAAPAATPSAAMPPPIARKPFYFIPGCYLGDVPPRDAGLPATCDQSRVVTFRP